MCVSIYVYSLVLLLSNAFAAKDNAEVVVIEKPAMPVWLIRISPIPSHYNQQLQSFVIILWPCWTHYYFMWGYSTNYIFATFIEPSCKPPPTDLIKAGGSAELPTATQWVNIISDRYSIYGINSMFIFGLTDNHRWGVFWLNSHNPPPY